MRSSRAAQSLLVKTRTQCSVAWLRYAVLSVNLCVLQELDGGEPKPSKAELVSSETPKGIGGRLSPCALPSCQFPAKTLAPWRSAFCHPQQGSLSVSAAFSLDFTGERSWPVRAVPAGETYGRHKPHRAQSAVSVHFTITRLRTLGQLAQACLTRQEADLWTLNFRRSFPRFRKPVA